MPKTNKRIVNIDASGVYYRDLNTRLRDVINGRVSKIELHNVHGQRYIGTDLDKPVEIEIFGTPGNDLGAFMNGPRIIVHGSAQDGCGNTMNAGEIIVHGRAGDVAGLSARGGKIYIRDDVGYRGGIHMKEYKQKKPVLIIGGTAQDFLGEYMAGGTVILLGLNLKEGQHHLSKYVGTGMHGGVIYIRGSIPKYNLGKEVGVTKLNEKDKAVLKKHITEFAGIFGFNADDILNNDFIKLYPRWLRPYGRLYAY
jgi:glutamate synthase domain-containing protein 3